MLFSALGVENVAQAVAEEAEAEADNDDGEARHGGDPPLIENEGAPARDHRAPFRQRRLRAQANEAEAGGSQDDARHVERDTDDHRGGAERQDMADDDAKARCALQPACGNEIGILEGQRFGPCNAGIARPGGDGDGKNGVFDAGAERCDQASARISFGMERKMSVMPISTRSTQPPR